MPTVTVGQENNADIEIYYEDHGGGPPVVLIHGYPLSGRGWDSRSRPCWTPGTGSSPTTGAGSAAPATGHRVRLRHLRRRPQYPAGTPGPARRGAGRALDGHRRGHPLPGPLRFGPGRQGRVVAPIPPYLLQADDNPDGVPQGLFDGLLVIHGDADQVLPLDKTASRLPGLIKDMRLVVVEGGPHAIPWTHADQVNTALLDFRAPEPAQLKEADLSSTEVHSTSRDAAVGHVGMHVEVQIIPVSDVDRAKQFYQRLGWRLNDDVAPLDGLPSSSLTPPGSAASITFGQGLTTAEPGSAGGGLVVSDIEAAHHELPAVASTSATSGTAAVPPEHGGPARTPSAPATGRSAPSAILTATRGWSRRSRRGSPAVSTAPNNGGAGRDRPARVTCQRGTRR